MSRRKSECCKASGAFVSCLQCSAPASTQQQWGRCRPSLPRISSVPDKPFVSTELMRHHQHERVQADDLKLRIRGRKTA
eukprot:scaffold117835_cov66-Phaeocystis_antarctica.AAC.6